ncbi:MAG: hypothetical protein AAB362_00635 [Patescibacteria group bacterium]
MTLDELQRDWRKYAIDFVENDSQILLSDLYMLCIEYEDGLLFDPGGEQGVTPAIILKSDDEGFCYCKMSSNDRDGHSQRNLFYSPDENGWVLIGKFIRIEN